MFQSVQNLLNLAMKMISYSFNVKNLSKISNYLSNISSKKMNSLPGKKNQYSVTICINSVQNRPNSSVLTEYRSYQQATAYGYYKSFIR